MLVSMEKILQEPSQQGYGIAAPNAFNMEQVEAIFQAADELKLPVIIDCAERFDLEAVAELTRFYDRRYPLVVAALNLDHGKSYNSAVRAIRAGYTSVMVDRSETPFEENIRETAAICKMAHAVGVGVEAEIGHVGRGLAYEEDRDRGLTEPEEAVTFVRATKVDCLAVAIGTAHGVYSGTPRLDFDRLAKIKSMVHIPLVLHGGSSTGDANLAKAAKLGIAKVNLATDLFHAGLKEMRQCLQAAENPRFDILFEAEARGYKAMLKHYMVLLSTAHRSAQSAGA